MATTMSPDSLINYQLYQGTQSLVVIAQTCTSHAQLHTAMHDIHSVKQCKEAMVYRRGRRGRVLKPLPIHWK